MPTLLVLIGLEILVSLKMCTKTNRKSGEISETTKEFCFVISTTDLNRPNTGTYYEGIFSTVIETCVI